MKKYILDTLSEKVDTMKDNHSLLKNTLLIGIIVMMSLFILTTTYMSNTAESKANAPTWKNGDDWFYKLDRAEGSATLKEEVTSENAEFIIDEKSYSCYMMERTWNLQNQTVFIKKFYSKDNLAHVGEVDQSGKRTYFGEPLKRFDFPLEVGDHWEGDTMQYIQKADEEEGEPQSKVNYTYEVIDEIKDFQVEAGEFDVYKLNTSIRDDDPSRSSPDETKGGGYAHMYFSPEVKNYVKIINYYDGEETGSQELHSYNVTDADNNNSPSIGTVTFGATTVSMVVLYKVVKKKNED